ncbi:MAG TPA: tryptophan synthase subunit beta, partial [Gemmatimonadaceae bacterium]|nr:tryptophan synthase subunit beta [Gemmatimonadaceae bacterium]
VSVTDEEALRAFQLLAKLEGVIPALETAHAIAWIDANAGRWKRDEPVLLCVSGRGDKDVAQVAETGILTV